MKPERTQAWGLWVPEKKGRESSSSRGCGNCGKPAATRQGRAVFQVAVGNRPRPAKGGRFSKAVVGGLREGRDDRPKAGRAFRGPSTSAGSHGSFHSPPSVVHLVPLCALLVEGGSR